MGSVDQQTICDGAETFSWQWVEAFVAGMEGGGPTTTEVVPFIQGKC